MPDNIDLTKMHRLFLKLPKEEMQKVMGNSKALMLIFNHIDKLDGNADGNIETEKVFNTNNWNCGWFADNFETLVKDDVKLTDREQRDKEYVEAQGGYYDTGEGKFILDEAKIADYIEKHEDLKGVSVGDMINFFKSVLTTDQNLQKIESEKWAQEEKIRLDKLQQENNDIPRAVLEQTFDDYDIVSKINLNGKKHYKIESNSGDYGVYNSNGELVGYSERYEYDGGTLDELTLFSEGEDKHPIRRMTRYNDLGMVDEKNYLDKTFKRTAGKTQFSYQDDKLQEITVNRGLPNEMKLTCEYDENGKIADFKPVSVSNSAAASIENQAVILNSPIKMSDKEKEILKNLVNSGSFFGEDYTLELSGNEVKISPVVKNNTDGEMPSPPQSFTDEVVELVQKGLKNGVDYKLSYGDYGFEINFETGKGRDFATEDTRIVYSKDGKVKTTHKIAGNSVTTEVETSNSLSRNTVDRDNAFLEALLLGDYKDAERYLGDIEYQGSDFDFYKICQKYEEIKGKHVIDDLLSAYDRGLVDENLLMKLIPNTGMPLFMGDFTQEQKKEMFRDMVKETFEENITMYEQINNFDVKNSQIGNLIPTRAREVLSDNKCQETFDGQTYTIVREVDVIKIEKNGEVHELNLKGLHENIKKMIFESSAPVIYRLASQGIKLEMFSSNGNDNVIANGKYMYEDNKILLNADSKTLERMKTTLAHETGHSFYGSNFPRNVELEKVFKEEQEKFKNSEEQYKDGDHTYCSIHIYEMVAESYSLLTTGHAKSEYTIAKHFPKTFAMIKQLIEEQSQ